MASPASRLLAIVLASALFAALFQAFHPGFVFVFNDDFAYLRSLVATIQRGRPWTDAFLEPWAISLTSISAGLWHATGSFLVATVGLQVASTGISFFLLALAILRQTERLTLALTLSVAVLLFPTAWWKQAEYTAMTVYLPALLLCAWSAVRAHWGWFTVGLVFGITSRQSALLWIFLPVAEALGAIRHRAPRRAWLTPGLAAGCGVLFFVAAASYANDTHAQRLITGNVLRDLNLSVVLLNTCVGLWVGTIAWGCVSAVAILGTERPQPTRSPGVWCSRLIAVMLLLSVPFVASGIPLSFEHPLFDWRWARVFLMALTCFAAIGWILSPPRLNSRFGMMALLALLPAVLRSQLWDYYLIDAAIFGLFAALPPAAVNRSEMKAVRFGGPRFQPWVGAAMLAAVLMAEACLTFPLKRSLDGRAGACLVLEEAIRCEWMDATELSDAPFGFVAWHLFPYYLEHHGASSADLGGFGQYVAERTVEVRIHPLQPGEVPTERAATAAAPPVRVLPLGWLQTATFTLERRDDSVPAPTALDRERFRANPFPIDDEEWRRLIDRP